MARILVLDDQLDAVNLLRRILESSGHEVFAFTDEDAALDFVAHNAVDLAVLDIRLKKMSGMEVLEKIKQTAPPTRVIMLTAYPTMETSRKGIFMVGDIRRGGGTVVGAVADGRKAAATIAERLLGE